MILRLSRAARVSDGVSSSAHTRRAPQPKKPALHQLWVTVCLVWRTSWLIPWLIPHGMSYVSRIYEDRYISIYEQYIPCLVWRQAPQIGSPFLLSALSSATALYDAHSRHHRLPRLAGGTNAPNMVSNKSKLAICTHIHIMRPSLMVCECVVCFLFVCRHHSLAMHFLHTAVWFTWLATRRFNSFFPHLCICVRVISHVRNVHHTVRVRECHNVGGGVLVFYKPFMQ